MSSLSGLFAVAVVRFIVDDDDVREAHKFFRDSDHLAFGFLSGNGRVTALWRSLSRRPC